jgi:23S rRNA pseudouridine2604 synthase
VVVLVFQGRNRQIRRMCEVLGYEVIRLHRERIMSIELGGLRVGEWVNLTADEMKAIEHALDLLERQPRPSRAQPPPPPGS